MTSVNSLTFEVDNMAENLVSVMKTPEKQDDDKIISGEPKV